MAMTIRLSSRELPEFGFRLVACSWDARRAVLPAPGGCTESKSFRALHRGSRLIGCSWDVSLSKYQSFSIVIYEPSVCSV